MLRLAGGAWGEGMGGSGACVGRRSAVLQPVAGTIDTVGAAAAVAR